MDSVQVIIFLCGAALWLVVFALHSLRFLPSAESNFELNERIVKGEELASSILERNTILPRLRAIRYAVETTGFILAVLATVTAFGGVLGVVIAIILAFLLESISKHDVVARQTEAFYRPFEPRVIETVRTWRWLDMLAGYMPSQREKTVTSKAELVQVVSDSPHVLSSDEKLRFLAGISLDERQVLDVMTPVSVADTADVHDTLGPLVLDSLHKTGHSRFPVIDGDIHHVVGVLYLHQLVDLKKSKTTVREAMDAHVHYIGEHQTLEHALHGFLRTRKHLFIVVNTYRETVGILTLEDVIEAILGKKIVDEFDKFDDLRAVAESNPRKNNDPKKRTDI